MNESKVSIIMSTYQTEETQLKQAIESILGQTYSNLELIIVCDGICKDIDIIKQYKDNRIHLIENEVNRGLPYSLNRAIEHSEGKYIARMDSDDIAVKNRIEEQVKFMEKHPEIAVCSMYAKLIGDESGYKILVDYHAEEIKAQLLYRACMIHPCVMIRKEKLKGTYRYNEEFKYAQDFELWTRMIDTEKMQVIPKIGLYYRVHKKQASIDKREQQMNFAKRILIRNLNKIQCDQTDEKSIEAILILSGRKSIEESNYKMLSQWIEKVIEKNKKNLIFNPNILKKILYTRFFILLIKKKNIIKKNFNSMVKDKTLRRQLFSHYNITFLLKTLYITTKIKLEDWFYI